MIINSSENLDLLQIRLALDILNRYSNKQSTKELRELLDLCKTNNLKAVNQKIKDFPEYETYIPNTSIQQFVEDSNNILHELFSKELISEVRFKQLVSVFAEKSVSTTEYEEEPEETTYSHLTQNVQSYLNKLEDLLRKNNPRTMSVSELKDFSSQFRDITKQFGISKFQQYFDDQRKTITSMNISYAKNQNENLTYQMDFDLLDDENNTSHLTLSEPVNKSTNVTSYYQNLCFSYLTANELSRNF